MKVKAFAWLKHIFKGTERIGDGEGGCDWRDGRCLAKSGGGGLVSRGGLKGGLIGGVFREGEQPYEYFSQQWQ